MGPNERVPYPLDLTTLSSANLAASTHVLTLHDLINRAFEHSHRNGRGTVLLTERRLQGPSQILEELGSYGFCILAFAASNAEDGKAGHLIATASAKPYFFPGDEREQKEGEQKESLLSNVNKMFKRTAPSRYPVITPETDMDYGQGPPAWEILLMAVDPDLQGRGIASKLLNLTTEKIQEEVRKDYYGSSKVKLLLSTMQELNEEYYERQGWRTTNERRFRAGTGGSEAGFGIVEMIKIVE